MLKKVAKRIGCIRLELKRRVSTFLKTTSFPSEKQPETEMLIENTLRTI